MKSTVKSRLSDVLKTSKIDEVELASMIQKPASTIYRIVNGETENPSRATIQLISDALKVNFDYLWKGEGEIYKKAGSDNPWKDALVDQLRKEAEAWQEKYNQVWSRLEFLMDRIPTGKFKALHQAGLQKGSRYKAAA